jgi:hypothetical protein
MMLQFVSARGRQLVALEPQMLLYSEICLLMLVLYKIEPFLSAAGLLMMITSRNTGTNRDRQTPENIGAR